MLTHIFLSDTLIFRALETTTVTAKGPYLPHLGALLLSVQPSTPLDLGRGSQVMTRDIGFHPSSVAFMRDLIQLKSLWVVSSSVKKGDLTKLSLKSLPILKVQGGAKVGLQL